MPRKQQSIEPESETPNTFEATLQALKPFVKSYSMASGQRVKLRMDTNRLSAYNVGDNDRVTLGVGACFVRFDDMTNEDAAAIAARVFGETE